MKLCTFLKQEDNIILQFIEPNNQPTGIIKSNILLNKNNIEKIRYEIESHFNVQLTDNQKYFIENNNKGVLEFLWHH